MSKFVTTTSHKSKMTALLLCIFGGVVGAHYFYVGRFARGVITMLTLNFFTIGWFLDALKILRGRFRDQYGEYLKE